MAKKYRLIKPLTNEGHKVLLQNIHEKFNGRICHRAGKKRDVSYYAVGESSTPNVLNVHLSSKQEQAHFTFTVERDEFGPEYQVTAKPGNKASLVVMERLARHAATHLYRNSIKPFYDGDRDTSNQDGYYLRRRRRNGYNADGKDLAKAISEGEMHFEFGETLKRLGIYVKEY